MHERMRVHATCVEIEGRGVLIRGKPGSGKSDLALRLMDMPGCGIGEVPWQARLVADDQVEIFRVGEKLVAQAPEQLAGLLEIRGLGIVRVKPVASVPLVLVVDLDGLAERLPGFGSDTADFLGKRLPLLYLSPFAASAVARLRAGLQLVLNQRLLHA